MLLFDKKNKSCDKISIEFYIYPLFIERLFSAKTICIFY